MPGPGGILAIDLGVHAGWCYGNVHDLVPDFGGWELPVPADLTDVSVTHRDDVLVGARGAALENELEGLMALLRPRYMAMALRFAASQTSAYLLTGLAVAAEISAYRQNVLPSKVAESEARKHVLGRGSFSERDPDNQNRAIKGTGTERAKKAAVAWCLGKGWKVPTHDVAEACVIWEFERRRHLAKRQWGELKDE